MDNVIAMIYQCYKWDELILFGWNIVSSYRFPHSSLALRNFSQLMDPDMFR